MYHDEAPSCYETLRGRVEFITNSPNTRDRCHVLVKNVGEGDAGEWRMDIKEYSNEQWSYKTFDVEFQGGSNQSGSGTPDIPQNRGTKYK